MFLRKTAVWLVAGGLLGLATGVPPAWADDPIGRLSLSVNFGVSSFLMGDVNDEIGRGNQDFFRAQNFKTMNDLTYGFNFMADFKTAIRDPFFITVGGGTIRGNTGVSFNEIVDVNATGNLYYARLLYALPWRPLENSRLFAGGGPVLLRNVELEVSHERDEVAKRPEREEVLTMKGDGTGLQIDLIGEYLLSDHVTVALNFGYRNATADLSEFSIEVNNAETRPGADTVPDDEQVFGDSYLLKAFLQDPGEVDSDAQDGPRISDEGGSAILKPTEGLGVDFSGVHLDLGLRLYFF